VSFFPVFVSMLSGCDGIERIDIVEEKCGKCHKSDIVYLERRTKQDWERVVHGMKVSGMKITEEEERELMSELYNKLGK